MIRLLGKTQNIVIDSHEFTISGIANEACQTRINPYYSIVFHNKNSYIQYNHIMVIWC